MLRVWSTQAFNPAGPVRRMVLAFALVMSAGLCMADGAAGRAKYAAIVIDVETGRVLHARNADSPRYPASLAKIMTLHVVFDQLRAGRLKLTDKVKFSRRAARQPASKLGLRVGQSITVEQAILALVTKSANDVATALAERISRTEKGFARHMTVTAHRLGMTRTTFRNASGLPHSGQQSTARDMSRLALAMLRNHPRYYHYFSRQSFDFDGWRHENHNKLLVDYAGADGIKTGYIHAAGFNLVASAERKGRRLIGVVYGGKSAARRDREMRRLLDQGFDRAAKILPPPHRSSPPVPSAKPVRVVKPDDGGKPARRSAVVIGHWAVQVGAYGNFHAARRQALRACDAIGDLLRRQGSVVAPVVDGKRLYRARLVGLKRAHAERACQALKSKRIDCLALPPPRATTSFRRPVS